MARNWIQFQKGYSLTQFMDEYGTEERCVAALFRWRWPNGFVCPPGASIPGTGAFKAVPCISVAVAGTRCR